MYLVGKLCPDGVAAGRQEHATGHQPLLHRALGLQGQTGPRCGGSSRPSDPPQTARCSTWTPTTAWPSCSPAAGKGGRAWVKSCNREHWQPRHCCGSVWPWCRRATRPLWKAAQVGRLRPQASGRAVMLLVAWCCQGGAGPGRRVQAPLHTSTCAGVTFQSKLPAQALVQHPAPDTGTDTEPGTTQRSASSVPHTCARAGLARRRWCAPRAVPG